MMITQCRSCGQKNRILGANSNKVATCGRCGSDLILDDTPSRIVEYSHHLISIPVNKGSPNTNPNLDFIPKRTEFDKEPLIPTYFIIIAYLGCVIFFEMSISNILITYIIFSSFIIYLTHKKLEWTIGLTVLALVFWAWVAGSGVATDSCVDSRFSVGVGC
jgi:hypothetical protein